MREREREAGAYPIGDLPPFEGEGQLVGRVGVIRVGVYVHRVPTLVATEEARPEGSEGQRAAGEVKKSNLTQ